MTRQYFYRLVGPAAVLVGMLATVFVAGTHAWRPAPTDFIWISAGDYHTCASRFDGTTWCWGANDQGQLGNGGAASKCPSGKACMYKPQPIRNVAFGQVDAGGDTTCALSAGGAAFCWGDNTYGQTGTNFLGLTSYSSPQAVMGGHVFASLSTGSTASCGLTAVSSGPVSLYCWGLLITGNTSTFTPTLVGSSTAFWEVSVGNGQVCTAAANAIASDIDCAGLDNYGQLGVNPLNLGTTALGPTSTTLAHPLFSSLGSNAEHVSAAGSAFGYGGGGAYTCADQMSGVVQCVGNNEFGQLGLGFKSFGIGLPNNNFTYLPQTVGNGQPLVSVTTGMSHACAIDPYTAYAWCWGQSSYGEVGNGYLGGIWGPQLVNGGLAVRSITAGKSHTCAITTSNHILCWGDNRSGQLGVSTALSGTSYPQQVF